MSALGRGLALWVVIAPWEMGLRVRMGKRATVLHPGVRFRIPGLDRVYVQSCRLRTVSDSGLTSTTRDGHSVTLTLALHFAVADIERLYSAGTNPEITIRTVAAAAVARLIAGTPRDALRPDDIAHAARQAVGRIAGRYGINQVSAELATFAFVRSYRLISNDYWNGSGLYNFETEGSGRR